MEEGGGGKDVRDRSICQSRKSKDTTLWYRERQIVWRASFEASNGLVRYGLVGFVSVLAVTMTPPKGSIGWMDGIKTASSNGIGKSGGAVWDGGP